MATLQGQRRWFGLASRVVGLVLATSVSLTAQTSVSAGEQNHSLKDAADGLRTNAEDMVAHGGMGDAKAILHHCGEAARYAEVLIKQLPASHARREEGVASLNDVIRYCKRVSEIGVHADPGVLLNPAIKARAAARASVSTLGLLK